MKEGPYFPKEKRRFEKGLLIGEELGKLGEIDYLNPCEDGNYYPQTRRLLEGF